MTRSMCVRDLVCNLERYGSCVFRMDAMFHVAYKPTEPSTITPSKGIACLI